MSRNRRSKTASKLYSLLASRMVCLYRMGFLFNLLDSASPEAISPEGGCKPVERPDQQETEQQLFIMSREPLRRPKGSGKWQQGDQPAMAQQEAAGKPAPAARFRRHPPQPDLVKQDGTPACAIQMRHFNG